MSNFTGDDRLMPFVDFSRSHLIYCIYCGAPATTREHAPSKAFLKKPYPSDLPFYLLVKNATIAGHLMNCIQAHI